MNRDGNYEMEDLIPIAGKLAREYAGTESTSLTYERARQLMEAVLYCIREAEASCEGGAALAERMSPRQAYETGAFYVKEKVKAALELYHELLPEFDSYGNVCLEDTFLKGMPEFFKWYDAKFEPQNTILTMDYPVLRDLSGMTGIDRIYEFLECIRLEQQFLKRFPREDVEAALGECRCGPGDAVENLCALVLEAAVKQLLGDGPSALYLAGTVGEAALRLKYANLGR